MVTHWHELVILPAFGLVQFPQLQIAASHFPNLKPRGMTPNSGLFSYRFRTAWASTFSSFWDLGTYGLKYTIQTHTREFGWALTLST